MRTSSDLIGVEHSAQMSRWADMQAQRLRGLQRNGHICWRCMRAEMRRMRESSIFPHKLQINGATYIDPHGCDWLFFDQ
jgi:hypothetical protein